MDPPCRESGSCSESHKNCINNPDDLRTPEMCKNRRWLQRLMSFLPFSLLWPLTGSYIWQPDAIKALYGLKNIRHTWMLPMTLLPSQTSSKTYNVSCGQSEDMLRGWDLSSETRQKYVDRGASITHRCLYQSEQSGNGRKLCLLWKFHEQPRNHWSQAKLQSRESVRSLHSAQTFCFANPARWMWNRAAQNKHDAFKILGIRWSGLVCRYIHFYRLG